MTASLEVDQSNKLKLALKKKVENSSCAHVKTGDKVYFRRSFEDCYLKGTVVGQIGATV